MGDGPAGRDKKTGAGLAGLEEAAHQRSSRPSGRLALPPSPVSGTAGPASRSPARRSIGRSPAAPGPWPCPRPTAPDLHTPQELAWSWEVTPVVARRQGFLGRRVERTTHAAELLQPGHHRSLGLRPLLHPLCLPAVDRTHADPFLRRAGLGHRLRVHSAILLPRRLPRIVRYLKAKTPASHGLHVLIERRVGIVCWGSGRPAFQPGGRPAQSLSRCAPRPQPGQRSASRHD